MEIPIFQNIRQEILTELDKATTQIKVAVAWFTNHHLFEKLCEKLLNGVKVELIVIDDYINNGDWGLDFQYFINNGGKLYYGHPDNPMHHKFCIIDNAVLFNGSYNWTYYAESLNVENVVKFTGNAYVVEQFDKEFERLKATLSLAVFAVKRAMREMESVNFFSVRNYVSQDLFYHGKQNQEVKFVEEAARLVPTNMAFKAEYNRLSQQVIVKRTITSLGVAARINGFDNQFSIIIPKGTEVPCTKSSTFFTVYDNQTSIGVRSFKGENQNVDLNTAIGSFHIADLPSKPAGQTAVEETFSLSRDGVLTVRAKSLDTGSHMEAVYYQESLIH